MKVKLDENLGAAGAAFLAGSGFRFWNARWRWSSRLPSRLGKVGPRPLRPRRPRRTSRSDLVARYVIEKSLETEFPGISFRDSLSGREAYLTGRRVAVWEVVAVHDETKSADRTARHFGWPRVLVMRALAYAKAFPGEISRARTGETPSVAG